MDEKVVELQSLVKELREKFEQKEQGLYTKAEFEEFEAKINERIALIAVSLAYRSVYLIQERGCSCAVQNYCAR